MLDNLTLESLLNGFLVVLAVGLLLNLIPLFVVLRTIWHKGSYYKRSRHDVKIDNKIDKTSNIE